MRCDISIKSLMRQLFAHTIPELRQRVIHNNLLLLPAAPCCFTLRSPALLASSTDLTPSPSCHATRAQAAHTVGQTWLSAPDAQWAQSPTQLVRVSAFVITPMQALAGALAEFHHNHAATCLSDAMHGRHVDTGHAASSGYLTIRRTTK